MEAEQTQMKFKRQHVVVQLESGDKLVVVAKNAQSLRWRAGEFIGRNTVFEVEAD